VRLSNLFKYPMIARLQRFLTLAMLLVSLLCAAFFWHREARILASALPVLILSGYAILLGVEFVLLAFLGGNGVESPRARPLELIRAWLAEVWRTPAIFCWRQPFRANKEPDMLAGENSRRRGVVLVHGFVCNRGFWNPWMKMFRRLGVPFVAVNLEPPFGSISTYTSSIGAAVSRLESATGKPPVIVAHSMGGLAVREWLAECEATHAYRVVTIGTPHRGTWLARFGRALNTIEMRPSSDWIRALERREGGFDRGRFTCFYGNCDNIVFPTINATLPGADNRHLSATAHVQMAQHPKVIAEVLKWVAPHAGVADEAPERLGAIGSNGSSPSG
jgi:triacylglycerol lipase